MKLRHFNYKRNCTIKSNAVNGKSAVIGRKLEYRNECLFKEPTQSSNLLEAAMRECGLIGEQTEEETGSTSAALHNSSSSIRNQNSSMQNPSILGQTVIPISLGQSPGQLPRSSVVVYQSHANSIIRNPSSFSTHQVAVQRGVTKNIQTENALSGNLLLGLNNANLPGGRQARIVSVSRLPSLANAPGLKRMVPFTIGSPGVIPTNPSFGRGVTLVSGIGTQIVAMPRTGSTDVTSVTGVKPTILSSPVQTFQQFQANVGPMKTQSAAVRGVPTSGANVNRASLQQAQFSVRKMQPVQVSVSMQNRVQVPSLIGAATVQRFPTATGNAGMLSQILRPSSPAGPGVIRLTNNVTSSSSASLFVQPGNPAGPSVIRLAPTVVSSSASFVQPAMVTGLGTRQPARLFEEGSSSLPATLAGKRIIRLAPVSGTVSSQTIVQSIDSRSLVSSGVSDGGLSVEASNKDVCILRQGSLIDHSGVLNFKTNSSPNLTMLPNSVRHCPTSATSTEKNIAESTDASIGSDDGSIAAINAQTDSSPPVTFHLSDEENEDDPNDFMAALRQLRDNNKKAEEIEATRRAKQLSEIVIPSASKLPAADLTVSDSSTLTSLMYGQQKDTQAERLQIRPSSSPHSAPPQMFSLLGAHQRLSSGLQTIPLSNLGPLGVRNLTVLNASSKSVYNCETSSGFTVGTSSLQVCTSKLPPGGRTFTNQMSMPSFSSSPALSAFLVDKVTGKVWVNDIAKQGKFVSQGMFLPGTMAQQSGGYLDIGAAEPEVEEEELGHAETYADYKPAKLSIGCGHPDPAVESSSLSSVEPPDIEYVLNLPKDVILEGRLSSLQLETITYACQKHETYLPNRQRVGYLVGDGAGVGKGRTIAGIIFENFRCGRKRALWLSVSNDLLEDARRDLSDVGAQDIELHALNKFKYAKISSKINQKVKRGVIFATYSSLIGESQKQGKYSTRMKQVLRWLGKEFEGLIIFDECHRAKNLIPNGSSKATKTGLKVVELQDSLPNARIVYASATGASEPKNMAYMVRLGLWGIGTPFKDFGEFHSAIKKRGVGAMELVAMEMKQRGTYIARQLSFQGVSFKIVEVNISDRFVKLYNECVRLWVKTREYFHEALELLNNDQAKYNKTAWGQYWSTHQRFFKYICISTKVAYVVELSLEAVEKGKSVVIGLQSTGEAKTLEQLESHGWELTEFVSTAKGVFQKLIESHFPNPDNSESWFGCDEMSSQPIRAKEESGKRKMTLAAYQRNSKRLKLDADCSGSDSKKSSESDSTEEEQEEEEATDSLETSEVEGNEEDEEEESVERGWGSESDDDDTNPFAKASGSDDDSDPWIRKPKKRLRELEPKKSEKKSDKKLEKKTKKKRSKLNSSDEEFGEDFEEQAAKAVTFLSQKEVIGSQSKSTSHKSYPDTMSARDRIAAMKRELLADIEELGPRLPSNTLDELIEKLGGKDAVAEMTGRKGRMVMTASGIVQYESRGEVDATLENINNTERQRFMEGIKRIAIISEAASSGISLHADRRSRNQTRRVHITLELPWSADRAIQQFGRTHRSNQVNSPEYIFLISELAGERRFAATVAKRLESLGALTHGDRRATETRDLSQFNIDNRYGQQALSIVIKFVLSKENPLVKVPDEYKGDFCADVQKALAGVGMGGDFNRDKDQNQISKFLNRILGMEVAVQNALFQYFTSTLEEVILTARREGTWDLGILDIGSSGEHVIEKETREFSGLFSGFQTKIRLTTVIVERGINWSLAVKMLDENTADGSGFFSNKQQQGCRSLHILALGRKKNMYKIYKPNMGITSTLLTSEDLKNKYVKVTERDTAKRHWEEQYEASSVMCQHQYQFKQCRSKNCETGRRTRLYHILSGSVLSVWTSVEKVLKDVCSSNAARMQVIRVRTTTGKRIVGTLIPAPAVEPLTKFFKDTELSKTKPQGRTASANNLTNLISNSL